MMKYVCLYCFLFFAATSQQLYGVSSGGAPGDTITLSRYNTQQQQPQQHQQQQQPPLAPLETSAGLTRQQQQYNQQQQQQQHQQQQQQQQQQQYHPAPGSHHPGGGGGGGGGVVPGAGAGISVPPGSPSPHGSHHHAPGSGHAPGHVGPRNTYNILSEAMTQAVSNEFSSLGSGSADGACHVDDLECYSSSVQDRLGMEAIKALHRQLDDDDNGNIDLSESDDFLREELKYDSGYERRQKAFHFNDDMHISVKELWEAWLRSEVHNWTMEQTTDWLAQSVQLPQYVELFKQHKVTGASLPRLAVNNMHYVSNVLGIKDPIHKQKIALKAMDVVLFGPPRETGTRWKDYILVTLLLSAIIGCWYAYQQNKNAKRHLRRMAQDMEGLQKAEQSLQEMQKELERARMEQENVTTEKMDLERRLKEAPILSTSNSDLEVQQLKKEIDMLRKELSRAEIELVDNCWAPPPQLQSWLQYTYELESKNHLKKRIAAEKQLQSAREACEKLRKKRSSLVGAFVSTHGKSIDDVDRSIVEARNSLGEVTNELQERLHRWKQIETCLGFNIVNNNGISYLESVLYGRNGIGSAKGSRGRMTSSTDDLDDESVQGMIEGYSRTGLSGSSAILNNSCNALRDDSSGSDDGADSQSVQFYLGNAPSAPIINPTTPILPAVSAQRAHHLPSLDGINHIGNTSSNSMITLPTTPMPAAVVSLASPATGITSTTAVTNAIGTTVGGGGAAAIAAAVGSSPPPLPPHSNAYTGFNLNDSINVSTTGVDDNQRHSPSSASSERSIPIPPRAKKPNILPPIVTPTPPPSSISTGRAPQPPPRKATQSQMLRSQSTDLVPMEIYSFLSKQQQQQQHLPQSLLSTNSHLTTTNSSGTGIATIGGGGGGIKKMVKQHSTTSQQSSSSTSSSVQSAPSVGESGKGNSPGRWCSHERIQPAATTMHEHQLLLQQQQHHNSQQQQRQQQHQQQHQQYAGDQEPLLQPQFVSTTTPIAKTKQLQQQLSSSHSLQSLCCNNAALAQQQQQQLIGAGRPAAIRIGIGHGIGVGVGVATATPAYASSVASTHSDTQVEDIKLRAALDSTSLDGSLKKRKRKLRFPFSRGKSGGSSSDSGKSKLT